MKRIVVYLLIASLLCLAAVSFAVVEGPRNPETQVYQVTTPKGQLNVRSRPDAGSKVVDKLSNRSFVKALSQEGGFYQVQLEKEQTGWVAEEFLTPTAYGEEVLTFRPMQIGSKGKDVAKLKERLLSLGYYRDNFSMSRHLQRHLRGPGEAVSEAQRPEETGHRHAPHAGGAVLRPGKEKHRGDPGGQKDLCGGAAQPSFPDRWL